MFTHQVITMCNRDYFPHGIKFLETRKNVNADFICYHPDLTLEQIDILIKHNIEPRTVDKTAFNECMQTLKFSMLSHSLRKYDNATFVDFDTFFVRDWYKLFKDKFDLGITVRNEAIKKRDLKCLANGGVIFAKGVKGKKFCQYATNSIINGYANGLYQYDLIFKTLEDSHRPEHKRYFRTNKRWWCDQVFLSALVLCYVENTNYPKIDIAESYILDNEYKVKFLNCKKYNNINATLENYETMIKSDIYIGHLKEKGKRDEIEQNI